MLDEGKNEEISEKLFPPLHRAKAHSLTIGSCCKVKQPEVSELITVHRIRHPPTFALTVSAYS